MSKGQKLTAAECNAIVPGQTLWAGNGLALVADAKGARWRLRYTSPETKKRREAGCGGFPNTTLAAARERASELRALVQAGIDPLEDRTRTTAAAKASTAKLAMSEKRASATLRAVATEYHKHHAASLRNVKHAAQWLSSLEGHVFPKLGDRPIGSVTTDDLLEVLAPLADKVPETASRVRQRLDVIFADALLNDLCDKNPASMIRRKLRRPKNPDVHLRSLPYRDVPAFVRALRAFTHAALPIRLALEFLIYTASRPGEVRFMRWSEVHGDMWDVPAERMKKWQDHHVPLPDRGLAILDEARAFTDGKPSELVFTVSRKRTRISENTMNSVLKRMLTGDMCEDGQPQKYHDLATVHGFRASFKAWAEEQSGAKTEVIEAAMSHREKDRVAAAYAHGVDYATERARLAHAWARFVGAEPAAVINLTTGRAVG